MKANVKRSMEIRSEYLGSFLVTPSKISGRENKSGACEKEGQKISTESQWAVVCMMKPQEGMPRVCEMLSNTNAPSQQAQAS